jgi:hypothetical protein
MAKNLSGTRAEHAEEFKRLAGLAETYRRDFDRAVRSGDCFIAFTRYRLHARLSGRMDAETAWSDFPRGNAKHLREQNRKDDRDMSAQIQRCLRKVPG